MNGSHRHPEGLRRHFRGKPGIGDMRGDETARALRQLVVCRRPERIGAQEIEDVTPRRFPQPHGQRVGLFHQTREIIVQNSMAPFP